MRFTSRKKKSLAASTVCRVETSVFHLALALAIKHQHGRKYSSSQTKALVLRLGPLMDRISHVMSISTFDSARCHTDLSLEWS